MEEGDQYATTLSKDVWDPLGFPASAFKEELAKSQQEILKKSEEAKARQQRESIDFVSPAAPFKVGGSASEAGSKGLRGSVAERVMAGLDRDRTRSPAAGNGGNLPERKHEGFQHRPNQRKRSRSR